MRTLTPLALRASDQGSDAPSRSTETTSKGTVTLRPRRSR